MGGMRLVIIGGASAYTPDIIDGLLREHQLYAGWELVLHDIDAPRLDIIAKLARAMIRSAGAEMTVRSTLDLDEAITGARFILTQPRVGGFAGRSLDERIPLKYGVIGQETLGPGGLSFALRSIPLMLQIVAAVRHLAPEAWIINYANPAGMVTEAVIRQYPDARFIGLCDMPTGVQWAIGKLLRVDYHRVDLAYAGINHGGWSPRVLLDGADIMSRLRGWGRFLGPLAALAPLGEETGTLRLFHRFGMIPDPYLRYYYYKDQILAKLQKSGKTRADLVRARLPALYAHYEAVAASEQPRLRVHRGHQAHGDLASQVIAAMASGRRSRFVIQQRNGGAVPNLPADGSAQFPAWVDEKGWEPIPQPPIAEAVAPLIQQVKAAESLGVTAALTGQLGLAIEAAAANPLVPGRRVAEAVMTELVKAHAAHLPQFRS